MMSLSSGELTHVSKQSFCRTGHSSAGSRHVCSTKRGLTGLRKMSSSWEPSPCPIPGLGSGVLEMRVKEGTKMRSFLQFVISRLQGEVHVPPASQVMFIGLDRAITKTITCTEIVKRNVRGLHQVSKLQYRNILELWENQKGEKVSVCKTVPSVCILLSKEPLDPQELGYQPPAETSSKSEEEEQACATAGKRQISNSSDVFLPKEKRICIGHDTREIEHT